VLRAAGAVLTSRGAKGPSHVLCARAAEADSCWPLTRGLMRTESAMSVRHRWAQHLTSASIASEGSVRILVLVGDIGGWHNRSVRRTVDDWGITVVVVTVRYPRYRWQSNCHVLGLVYGHCSVWVRSWTNGRAVAIRAVSCKPRL
jgi:hypothetical protein